MSRRTRALDELATTLLAAYDMNAEPPIDVELLARHLGVESISRRKMREDGCLEKHDGQARIFIRSDVGQARARFTIAHEIAHLVLAGPERNFIARRAFEGDWREERFCDQFAASLLMPDRWVRASFGRRAEDFSTLKGLADASNTSLSAALMRLREIASWRSSLLRWNRDGDRWRLSNSVGLPARIRNRITTTPDTAATLEKLNAGQRSFIQQFPIGVNGENLSFGAEVQMRSRSAAALVDMRSCLVSSPSRPLSRSLSHSEKNWGELG